jgi:hypothetical protein
LTTEEPAVFIKKDALFLPVATQKNQIPINETDMYLVEDNRLIAGVTLSLRILIAEDEESIRELLSLQLETTSHTSTCVMNGTLCLKHLKSQKRYDHLYWRSP